MIKFTSLINSLNLPKELVIEILKYLNYTEYKIIFLCDLKTYKCWASKQIKYIHHNEYKIQQIGNTKHSIVQNFILLSKQHYVHFKFDLAHNSHGFSQKMIVMNNNI